MTNKPNPKDVGKNVQNRLVRLAAEQGWRITTRRHGAVVVLSNRPEGEKA